MILHNGSAAVKPLTEDDPEMAAVDKWWEELVQMDVSRKTVAHKLKAHADELRKKRAAVAQELHNAQKRVKRIRARSKLLSEADLVLRMRMRFGV